MSNPGFARTIRTVLGAVFNIRINPDDNTNVVLSLEDSDMVVTLDPAAAGDLGHHLRKAGQYAAMNTVRAQTVKDTAIIEGTRDPLRGGDIQ